MNSLGDTELMEVFLNVGVQTLLPAKRVCKRWQSLISNLPESFWAEYCLIRSNETAHTLAPIPPSVTWRDQALRVHHSLPLGPVVSGRVSASFQAEAALSSLSPIAVSLWIYAHFPVTSDQLFHVLQILPHGVPPQASCKPLVQFAITGTRLRVVDQSVSHPSHPNRGSWFVYCPLHSARLSWHHVVYIRSGPFLLHPLILIDTDGTAPQTGRFDSHCPHQTGTTPVALSPFETGVPDCPGIGAVVTGVTVHPNGLSLAEARSLLGSRGTWESHLDTCLSEANISRQEIETKDLEATRLYTHHNVSCDGCGASSLVGPRYACACGCNFDLCKECLEKGVNPDAPHSAPEHRVTSHPPEPAVMGPRAFAGGFGYSERHDEFIEMFTDELLAPQHLTFVRIVTPGVLERHKLSPENLQEFRQREQHLKQEVQQQKVQPRMTSEFLHIPQSGGLVKEVCRQNCNGCHASVGCLRVHETWVPGLYVPLSCFNPSILWSCEMSFSGFPKENTFRLLSSSSPSSQQPKK